MILTENFFNKKEPTIMHVDLNSCFASCEQQANPFLRGRPVAVGAYQTDNGCIVSPSVEAKQYGVKVGMRVKDGKLLCPDLIVLEPNATMYRSIHMGLKKVVGSYTDQVYPKSIDEFVMELEGAPAYRLGMENIGREIKRRIKEEVGDWLRVSIGIGPNRFLAKTGAGLHKPDGLDVIDHKNYLETYMGLKLDDLCGIASNNLVRLNNHGIFTVVDFYNADQVKLKAVFQSVCGYYWWCRLRGHEIDAVEWDRKSFGHSYAMPTQPTTAEEYAPLLQKLVEKLGSRMRKAGYRARGIHVSLLYRDGGYWHKGAVQEAVMFDSRDIYKVALRIAKRAPYKKPIHTLAVSCFDLIEQNFCQTSLLEDIPKKENFVQALDDINERWGRFVFTPARMLGYEENVPDRVAFGGVRDLESLVLG